MNPEERKLLKRHLVRYIELATNASTPLSDKEEHFIKICQGIIYPENENDFACLKYKEQLDQEPTTDSSKSASINDSNNTQIINKDTKTKCNSRLREIEANLNCTIRIINNYRGTKEKYKGVVSL